MRALIVGAGAVGRYLAARLRLAGHDVVLYARPDSVQALLTDGVTLRVGEQEWPVSVGATADSQDQVLRLPFELALVAVKSFANAGAIAALRSVEGCSESTIMTLQNGLGSEEAFAEAFGANRIAAGVLTTAVERIGATSVSAVDRGGLSYAPVGDVPHNWLIAAFEGTGLVVRAGGEWRALKWSKLCINLIANGVCAALDMTPAQIYADPVAFGLERACLVETAVVMQKLKIPPVALVGFPVPVLVAAVRTLSAPLLRMVLRNRVATARGDKLPSLLLDLRAGRNQTEVDDLNGAVAASARRAGISASANETVARVVSGVASGAIDWELFRGKPQALTAAAGIS